VTTPARLQLATAAGLVALLATGCGNKDAPSQVILGNERLGTFAVKKDGSLGGLIRAFGDPTGRWHNGSGCVVRWRSLGLQASLYNLGGADPCTDAGGRFSHAEVTTPEWRTSTGLAVGDPVTRARQLFPRAKFGVVGKPRGMWLWLIPRVYPVGPFHYAGLAAKIVNERVVALRVQYPADGV
jgi:hypothetical protein